MKGAGRGGQTRRGTLTQLRGHEAKGSDQAGYDSRVTLVNPRIGDRAIDSGRYQPHYRAGDAVDSDARAQAGSRKRGTSDRLATDQHHRNMRDDERSSAPMDRGINKRAVKQTQFIKASSLGNLYQVMEDGIASLVGSTDTSEEYTPVGYADACRSPKWCESMSAERAALDKRGCWELVKIPPGVHLIKSRYVYKLKKDWTGKVVKWKSRLVILGCNQLEGIDFNETFAPVAKGTTFRLMVALAHVMGLRLHQLDVDSAFLYADLEEEIFMKPTPDMDIPHGYCLKLLKSLYGLKQAPRNWNLHIKEFILSLGFRQTILDNCLYVLNCDGELFLLSLYVDDIILAGANVTSLNNLKKLFTESFDIKDLGEVNHYLGMKITRSNEGIKIDQTTYAMDIVKRFSHLISSNDRAYPTPMDSDLKISQQDYLDMTVSQSEFAENFPYRNAIGALLYLSINTRPDISYAVGVLARHSVTTSYKACQAVLRVIAYVKHTSAIGIQFNDRKLNLHAFSDADWAGDLDSRRSTTGYVVFAAGGPIAWQSKLQSTVAASTMEAEYMAAFNAIQECVWIKGVMDEIGLSLDRPITLFMDSKSALCLANNPMYHKRSKHIDIKYHWIREKVGEDGVVLLIHVRTQDMAADVLTKALAAEPFNRHTDTIIGSVLYRDYE